MYYGRDFELENDSTALEVIDIRVGERIYFLEIAYVLG